MNSESYALITGASLGIGREIAIELAKRNINLILVALPGKELEDVSESLKKNYNIRVYVLGIDLTVEEAPKEVFEFVQSKNISINILINNAGLGASGMFYKSDQNRNSHMIKLNNLALVNITHHFIHMLMDQPRAYIMNVSSMEATLPLPYKSVYTATKGFIYSFSLALGEELKETNISMSVLCPGPVITNEEGKLRAVAMGKRSKILMKMPDFVAKKAVEGMFRKKLVIIPGIIPHATVKIAKLFPTKLKMKILERIFRAYKNT